IITSDYHAGKLLITIAAIGKRDDRELRDWSRRSSMRCTALPLHLVHQASNDGVATSMPPARRRCPIPQRSACDAPTLHAAISARSPA
ncbi:hypothetical protein, partial [Xanthomonas maliensis]|uniref:hypothetical protein n=1 Tax=Xanthomonas maliensis TaxID=1321368 RepID=UPI001EE30B58